MGQWNLNNDKLVSFLKIKEIKISVKEVKHINCLRLRYSHITLYGILLKEILKLVLDMESIID